MNRFNCRLVGAGCLLLAAVCLPLAASSQSIPFPGPGAVAPAAGGGASKLARTFNGTSDSLESASAIDLSSTKIISVFFRLYWDSFAEDGKRAITHSASDGSGASMWRLIPNSGSGAFDISYFTGGSENAAFFTRPSAAAWHDYLVILDNRTAGSHGASAVYVDGSLQTLTWYADGNQNNAVFGALPLYLMTRPWGPDYSAGRMSDIWIWAADESANASSLHSCGTGPGTVDSANIIAGWPIKQVSPETPDAGTVDLTVNGTSNSESACP
jgi:hypothetical protein